MTKGYALFALAFLITPAAASAATTTTVSPIHVRDTALAVSRTGRTVVAWDYLTRGRFFAEARVGASPRSLGRIMRFPRSHESVPRVAAGADGTVAVELSTRPLSVAIARPGHGFGMPRTIGGRNSGFAPAGVAVQPNGRVVALYTQRGGTLGAAIAPRGRPFATPRAISSFGGPTTPSLVVDARDGAVIAGYGTRFAVGGPASQAAVATLIIGDARFSAPSVLTATPAGTEPDVTLTAGTNGVAAAIQFAGLDQQPLVAFARGANGAWTSRPPVVQIAIADGTRFPSDFASVPLRGGAIASAWLLGLDVDPNIGPARMQAFTAVTPANGLAAAPRPVTATVSTGVNRPPATLALASAGNDAFAATASQNGPVVLTVSRNAGPFTRRTLASRGDGDVQLAAGGSHVLASYQRGDRIRLTTVR